jgi:mRNA-degrading endonuclease YafQ of YafQ-DinJ toxin-antitoxin module
MYKLVWHNSFKRAYQKTVRNNQILRQKTIATLGKLQENPYDPILKTHKLHGILQKNYACCIDFHYRIVFSIAELDSQPSVILIDIGTHDEVY